MVNPELVTGTMSFPHAPPTEINPNRPRVPSSTARNLFFHLADLISLYAILQPSSNYAIVTVLKSLHFHSLSPTLSTMPLITSSPSSSCSITSQTTSFGLCFSPSIISALKNSGGSGPSSVRVSKRNNAAVHGGSMSFASTNAHSRSIVDVVFEPFEEVKKELLLVPTYPHDSLARQKYTDQCEKAINDQINVEYTVSYVYHAMYAYFSRDNVALNGIAKFFKDSSDEERQHAEKLMEYQNKRGGKVKLKSMLLPWSEFDNEEKGDALHAMELALALEKLNNEKLLNLHTLAEENKDAHMADFIESEFLTEQVESIKKISEYVAQLRRVGKGHGVWHFDKVLLDAGVA
ncbi:ferritin-4, chloroplastic [Ziziphus jujuba]|uniref:Ferritin n=1 Tax=Ziziphus jujuba TaxID=326968 RepID=A0A6P3ZAZ3_ZIZJJ|nr:ferritin-4, chloroplastic [Ziziphus jujuba]